MRSSNPNKMTQVMKKLNEYIEETNGTMNKIDFITIAGDNYYSDKDKKKDKKLKTSDGAAAAAEVSSEGVTTEKKKDKGDKDSGEKLKKYNEENFLSGMRCLPISIKKYVLLGNHEYDILKGQDCDKYNKCFMINKQKENFTNTSYFDDVMYINKTPHTLILMIDTTLYDKKSTEKFNDMCFNEAFEKVPDDNKKDIVSLKEYQKRKVIEYIRIHPTVKNIIFIAHHPIITTKGKIDDEGKFVIKNELLEGLYQFYIDVYLELRELFMSKNIYHLCADNHLYQDGNIIMKELGGKIIRQIVCGTGGAEKDLCPGILNLVEERVSYEFTCVSINGFLDVIEDETGNLTFNFIRVPSLDIPASASAVSGGNNEYYYSKYIKYKNKYINLKNILN